MNEKLRKVKKKKQNRIEKRNKKEERIKKKKEKQFIFLKK